MRYVLIHLIVGSSERVLLTDKLSALYLMHDVGTDPFAVHFYIKAGFNQIPLMKSASALHLLSMAKTDLWRSSQRLVPLLSASRYELP